MRPHEGDSSERVFKFITFHDRTSGAPGIGLRPGLNVLLGGSQDDRRLLRSAFEALTDPGPAALEAMIEVGGSVGPVDATFAHLHGLVGRRPPILEIPLASSNNRPDPVVSPGPSEVRVRELKADEHSLTSRLELIGRDLSREREALGGTTDEPSGGANGPEYGQDLAPRPPAQSPEPHSPQALHPADVAVMCDRLRDLLDRQAPSEALSPSETLSASEILSLAEDLEGIARRKVYAVHRGVALEQLMEECSIAIASVQAFLDSSGFRSGEPSDATREERPEPDTGAERVEDASMHAQGIARLELLEELADFWRCRLSELEVDAERETSLLARAQSLLGVAGPGAAGGARVLASRLRSISTDDSSDTEAVRELVESLASYLRADSAALTPRNLLHDAEAKLAQGGEEPSPGNEPSAEVPAIPWREASADRVVALEQTQHQLRRRLDATKAELAAIERGLRVAPRDPRSAGPNPFGTEPQRSSTVDPVGGSWSGQLSLPEEVAALRTVQGVGTLPVLLVEPVILTADSGGSMGHEMGSSDQGFDAPDPLTVAAMALGGQVLWITDRPEVVAQLAPLGDDVGIIRV